MIILPALLRQSFPAKSSPKKKLFNLDWIALFVSLLEQFQIAQCLVST